MAFGLANYMGWTVRTIWLISGIGMLVTMFVDLILRAVTRNERKLPFDAEFLQISRAYGTLRMGDGVYRCSHPCTSVKTNVPCFN